MRYALSKNFLLPSFSMDILFLFAYQNEILFESLHWNLVFMVISYRKWLEFSYDGNSFFLFFGILFHKHDNFPLCVYKYRGSNVTVKMKKEINRECPVHSFTVEPVWTYLRALKRSINWQWAKEKRANNNLRRMISDRSNVATNFIANARKRYVPPPAGWDVIK